MGELEDKFLELKTVVLLIREVIDGTPTNETNEIKTAQYHRIVGIMRGFPRD